MERAPQTLVIDASAAAKWFLEEEDTEKALSLRKAHLEGKISLTAPDLLVYEVANTLNYNPKVSDDDLAARVQDLLEYDIDLVPPSSEYNTRIVRTAREFSISVYDASYLALSDMIATNLVTADRRLYEKLSGTTRIFLIDELDLKWKIQ